MRNLLFITAITWIFNGCYNAHYYPETVDPVQTTEEGDEINIHVPPAQNTHTTIVQPVQQQHHQKKKKVPKCVKWE
jgi:hypothetical protein